MHDEFRGALARQGISEEAYEKVSGKSHEDLHADFRPDAEKRVRVLLVLSRIAEVEGLAISDADVEAEIAKAASATPATRRPFATSRASAAGTTSARPSAGAASSSSSSTTGWPPIRSIRRSRTSRTAPPTASTRTRPGRWPTSTRPIRARSSDPTLRTRARRGAGRRPARTPRRPRPSNRPRPRPTSRRPPAEQSSTLSETNRSPGDPDARSDGHRVQQPWRARLRHLLAAAPGADHLPRRRDRGSRREPDHRPAPVPRLRGPGEGHQPVHQLARRHRDVRARDLRHDAVRPGARRHDLHRHGGVDGRRPAGRRRGGQALRPAERPDHDPPGLGRVPRRRPGRADPDEGVGVPRPAQPRDPGEAHEPAAREGDRGHEPGLFHVSRGGQGLWHHRLRLHRHGRFADRSGTRSRSGRRRRAASIPNAATEDERQDRRRQEGRSKQGSSRTR